MKWDEYFYEICNTVALKSNCLSRKIGAILVKDKSILATGYNGPARGITHCGMERFRKHSAIKDALIFENFTEDQINNTCPRYLLGYKSGEGLHLCIAAHAERNVLNNAARHGVETKGGILYMNCPIPCTPCLNEIINAGISEIVVTKEHYYDVTAPDVLMDSTLRWRVYEF